MTDADLIVNACGDAYAVIMAEVNRIDAKPWWKRIWVSDHQVAALLGAATALIALRDTICQRLTEEGR